jgi:hypothetical protein
MTNDIQGIERPPQEIQDYLLRIGGANPFGLPMWRLVLARNVIWKVQGGQIWDSSLSLAERGGWIADEFNHDGLGLRRSEARPLRDESDRLVEQQRYPHLEGWIIQRWFPPSHYNRAQWFAPENCLPDGTPKLGPFPQFGDYEMVGGPVENIPSRGELYELISAYWKNLESRSSSVATRVKDAENAARYALEKEEQRIRQRALDYMRDKCSYIWSSSLEAGRVRTAQAEKLGIREHVGS